MALSAECFEECNRLVLEAVNKNSIPILQLVKRFYSPIQLLTSLARYNEKGETPFVLAMKKKNVSIVNELVTWISRKDVYNNEECEPLVLNIIDQLAHHIPILEVIDYRISDIHQNTTESIKWMTFIAQFFIKSTSFTRQDKIVLLELIGAALIIPLCHNGWYAEQSVCGLECWREAMTLRCSPALGQPLIPKLPAVCVPSVLYSSVFGSAVEVATMEELDLLQEDFERNYLSLDFRMRLPCVKRMVIQANLVIRRISSQAKYIRNPNWLYLKSLWDFSSLLSYEFESKLKINTYLLIFEQLNGCDPKLISHQTLDIFTAALRYLSHYFHLMVAEPPGSPERGEISYTNLLMTPSKFISIIPKIFPKNADFTEIDKSVYHFLFVMDRISPQMADQDQLNLEKYYYDYIRYATTERKTTVLHVAMCRGNLSKENFNLTTIKLILKLGADPNAVDEDGRTALHILAEREELLLLHEYVHIVHVFQALVDAGTHLDMATHKGETVPSLLKKNVMRSKQREQMVFIHPYYESLLNTVFPLSCLAARVIRRNGIRFDEDRIPTHLQPFVAQHSAIDLEIDHSCS